MINPNENDIGREVIYTRTGESGTITSYNEHMIFVRYMGMQGSMGTLRRDLNFANRKVVADSCHAPDMTSKAIPMMDDED